MISKSPMRCTARKNNRWCPGHHNGICASNPKHPSFILANIGPNAKSWRSQPFACRCCVAKAQLHGYSCLAWPSACQDCKESQQYRALSRTINRADPTPRECRLKVETNMQSDVSMGYPSDTTDEKDPRGPDDTATTEKATTTKINIHIELQKTHLQHPCLPPTTAEINAHSEPPRR